MPSPRVLSIELDRGQAVDLVHDRSRRPRHPSRFANLVPSRGDAAGKLKVSGEQQHRNRILQHFRATELPRTLQPPLIAGERADDGHVDTDRVLERGRNRLSLGGQSLRRRQAQPRRFPRLSLRLLNGGTTGANDVPAQATADSRCNVHGVGCEQNQRRRVFAKPKLGRHFSVRRATDQLEVWIASTDRIEYHLVIEIDRCEQQASPGGRAAKLRSTLFQHFIRNRGGVRLLAVSYNCRQHDVVRRASAATLVLDQRSV